MPHVLVAGKLHPSGRALLDAAAGFTVRYVEEVSEASCAPFIEDADALLIRTQPMTSPTIAKAGRLKIVSRHGVGYDAVDVRALSSRNIALAICGDVNSTSVAEHSVMLILAAKKRVLRADAAVRVGPWEWRNRLQAQDIRGQNLLQIGYGRIGRHITTMMACFGMQLRAYDPFLAAQGWPPGDVASESDLMAGLAWADIVSISVPRTDGALIGDREIAAMKPGTVLVNTSRGGVIDEAALVRGLENGQVGAAGIDVFEQEPMQAGHPLTRFDQVILTPHIAGLTDGAAERMAIGSAQNIINFFGGTIDPLLVVNRSEIAHEQA